jgi:hypothetical protein
MKYTGQQIQRTIFASQGILVTCLMAELYRALACCNIAKRKDLRLEGLDYLMVAEKTSARFTKLHLQRKIFNSTEILELMERLEEALGSHPNQLAIPSPD